MLRHLLCSVIHHMPLMWDFFIISTLMWLLHPGKWVTTVDRRCLCSNWMFWGECVYVCVVAKDKGGIIMNSGKLSTISGINYSSVLPVSVIALILSAKCPKSPQSRHRRRPCACSAGIDEMGSPQVPFLGKFLTCFDLHLTAYLIQITLR